MEHRHARTLREVAHEDQDIEVKLTAHAYYVAMRTMSLKLSALAENYAMLVHRDRYQVSGEQVNANRSLTEMVEAINELAN